VLFRSDVSARDVVAMLGAPGGWRLVLGQALTLALAAVVFGALALVMRRLWSCPAIEAPALSGVGGHAGAPHEHA